MVLTLAIKTSTNSYFKKKTLKKRDSKGYYIFFQINSSQTFINYYSGMVVFENPETDITKHGLDSRKGNIFQDILQDFWIISPNKPTDSNALSNVYQK